MSATDKLNKGPGICCFVDGSLCQECNGTVKEFEPKGSEDANKDYWDQSTTLPDIDSSKLAWK